MKCLDSGGCERSVLPLPPPTKQTERAEATGEERESGGKRDSWFEVTVSVGVPLLPFGVSKQDEIVLSRPPPFLSSSNITWTIGNPREFTSVQEAFNGGTPKKRDLCRRSHRDGTPQRR
jgi:hypothetical protein